MKRLFALIAAVLLTATVWTQSPQKLSYQAVVRNKDRVLVQDKRVGIKISLLQGSAVGKEVYAETHTTITNANGLISVEIGGGAPLTDSFASIDWAKGPYFVKTEIDPLGETNYTITGTSELLSVPYALYSANGTPGPQGPQGTQGPTGPTGGYPVHAIGESYGGGIVFYVYDNGQHGLIAATADLGLGGWAWYSGAFTNTMANADGVGAGKANTLLIISNQGQGVVGLYAARICNEYKVAFGGVTYGDWYLPSKFELNLLYLQKAVVGNFDVLTPYWSSTEFDSMNAWMINFNSGLQSSNGGKAVWANVRAIRSF